MEESLCNAALRGDLKWLDEIMAKDNYILDKVLVGSFKGKNPLHVATSTGQAEFVLKLLEIKPKLAEVIDMELGAALHIASANGNEKIVEALLEHSPKMCMARNRDGYNPLHIAAMEDKVDVLRKLVQTWPPAALVSVDGGNTILHLCVSHNQLESLRLLLEMIGDPEFAKSWDAKGNTILHIAVFHKRIEIIEYLLTSTKINVNELNDAQWTAMDICSFVHNHPQRDEIVYAAGAKVDVWIRKFLHAAGAIRRRQMLVFITSPKVEKLVETLMVVSSLFATMAFQVGVNPPGGVWQDGSERHVAGKAILAYKYPQSYSCFMYFNTVGFLLSSFLIMLLLLSAVPLSKSRSWRSPPVLAVLTILITVFAYTYSSIVVSPKHTKAVTHITLVSAIMWAFLTSFVIAGGLFVFFERARPKRDRKSMSRLARDRPNLLLNADDENVSSV